MSYELLVGQSAILDIEYQGEDNAEAWENSPFSWIRSQPPRRKGTIGTRLAQSIFSNAGFEFNRVGNNGLVLGNTRVLARLSMEWSAGGFKFEQFKDDDYDYLFCLGLQPDAAYGWLIPKAEVYVDGHGQERDGLSGQHRGVAAQDTIWLSIDPSNVPTWLSEYGGSISAVETRIAFVFGGE